MIKKIIMHRYNGMYTDTYEVCYESKNGKTFWRTYTIKGEMIQKHFNFIMTHNSKPFYSRTGKHVGDKWAEEETPAPPLTDEELEAVEALKKDGTLYNGNDVEPW